MSFKFITELLNKFRFVPPLCLHLTSDIKTMINEREREKSIFVCKFANEMKTCFHKRPK